MKRLGRAIEIAAWTVFFAFAGTVLALRFWLLPDIERYREDIVAAFSRGIGLPVKVGAIEAGWLGLRPQITLSDVRVYDAQGREALVLPALDNVISWRSVLHGELRLHRLMIEAPRLTVRRDAAGDLYVAGLKLERGPGSGGGLAWLLRQGDIVVRDAEIEWRDELRGAPPLALSGVQLRLAPSGASISLGLSARPPAQVGSTLELRALVEAGTLRAQLPNGRLFLQIGYTDLAAWRAWFDYPVEVRQGQGALRVWASFENGELRDGTADVALADVWASLGDHLEPLELASVRGRVRGRALADGVELSGRGLALELERGPEIPQTDFQIVWRPQAGGILGASLIDLQATAHLVESLPLPPQIALALKELAPSGRLADSRLEWTGPFDGPQRFDARARFSDLTLQPREDAPGFSGLTGSIEATQDKGKLTLSSKKSALQVPRVLSEPIALESLSGQVEWQREGQGFAVRVASLNFANPDLSGNLFGSYAHGTDGPGSVDLSAVLNRADGAAVARYLPHAAVMGEKTRNWVANAVLAGQASDVRVRLRGELRDFPFADPAKGQFQVLARVDKGVLDYVPGWPRIDDIAAELTFEGERMEIVGRSGTLLGAQLSNVRVRIPNLRAPEPHVLIDGQAEGPSAEFLRFLAVSPLRKKAGDFVAEMKTAGRGKLRLNLDLPLKDLDATRVAGEYEFRANQVTVVSWLPPIEEAAGRVAFTDAGFTLQSIRGRLLGGALTVTGGARPGRAIQVVARGDASVEATQALFDHPLRRHLSGGFSYVVTVNAQDGHARVSFESPLRGLESALPAPLAKSAPDSLPLRVDVTPSASGERDRIDVTLGTLARAEVTRRRQGGAMQVQRTAVWVTPAREEPIRLPERPGTLIYGTLASFDADRWLPLFAGGSDDASRSVSLDMKFGTLSAYGRRFTKVALRASADAAGWSANVNADELAGDVSYRAADGGKVIARLDRFTIPSDAPGAKPAPASTRPSELPAIDLVADEFTFRDKALGRVELVARRDGEDWRIEAASMSNPDASFTGSGVWRGAPSRTALEFDMHAGDAGAFLARVGYPDLVKGGKARLRGTLDWRGDPATLDFPSLSGELQLEATDGQFLEIEPGAGKLLSLMSLQALPRRITLDFRDVFSKGFQFDRIGSNAQVESGVIKLKEFRMRGSAADVEMSGDADLARETQNLRVRVVPSLALGDTAALGITLFNPVAGVAAAIAQRLLKNPLGQIFAFDYSVSGTWSDPKVAKIREAPLTEPTPQ